jgi:hypothetical protein
MPAENGRDALDRWLDQQVRPLPPPDGTFELIARRARRRKVRKAVVSVASAAAVAAAVAVAVPVGMSLHLTTSQNANLAAGAGNSRTPSRGAQTTLVTGSEQGPASSTPAGGAPSASAPASALPSPSPSASGTASGRVNTPVYLPPDFLPSSVTWDSLSTGWVMGPGGTPGQCANTNPDICTSVARTDDGGQTWQGLPAPPVGGPETAAGVTSLRFLNATYGWAFGPELWATDDGGQHWHHVATGKSSVTDLETASGRAFALFADCAPPAGTTGDTIANCTSYTLETATAGSDTWTPVGGVPASLARTDGAKGSALLELAAATGTNPATGYLVAPNGTLYIGGLDGSAWHQAGDLPCDPGQAANDGLPSGVMLAPDGTAAAGATRLAIACAQPTTAGTVVYLSADNGSTWTEQKNAGTTGSASIGVPQSLTTLPDGTLILATTPSAAQPSGGIYRLAPDATQWQPATLSDKSGQTYGFTYVGMTSATQGVALGGDPALHAIWMTTDGGKTWQVRPIKSS